MCSKCLLANTTVSKCGSGDCAKRFYKLKVKNDKIAQVELTTAIQKAPNGYVTEHQRRVINLKQYLALKEAALLSNISPLTLRRWTLGGKMLASKIGKKWVYEKQSFLSTI